MVYLPHPRPRRVALLGARVQLANTIADVVDVSRTGVRIRASYEWRAGSEWPLGLEWPAALRSHLQARGVSQEELAATLGVDGRRTVLTKMAAAVCSNSSASS